jgi:hypothetical protein
MLSLRGSAAMALLVFLAGVPLASADTKTLTTAADFLAGRLTNVQVRPDGDGAVALAPVATPGGWQLGTALPSPVSFHAAAYYAGHVYSIGGRQGSSSDFVPDVFVSTLDANGMPGPWGATTPLPSGRAFHSAVAYAGYLYVIGGDKPGFVVTPEVWYAPIKADGQLGDWKSASPLPVDAGRDLAGVAAAYGRLYVVAGASNDAFAGNSTVFSADVKPDGSLTQWQEDRDLPDEAARLGAPAIFSYDHLYVVGGDAPSLNADVPLNTVWSALVQPDQKLGDWGSTTEMTVPLVDSGGNVVGSRPEPRYYDWNSGVAAGGNLILVGGHAIPDGAQEASPVSSVLVGSLNADGSVASWAFSPNPYPFTVSRTAAVVANDRIIVLGGRDSNGDDHSEVYVAPLVPATPAAVAANGLYESPIIDLGQTSNISSIQWETSGTATMTLRARVAEESGTWSAWTAEDANHNSSIQKSGRYVQFAVKLTSDGQKTGALTAVTINYGAAPTVVYGDLTGDGVVNISDALAALRISLQLDTPTPAQLEAGDVAPKPGRGPKAGQPFGDGVINILDVGRILRAALHLETQFP